MAEPRRPSVRGVAAMAVVIVGAVEVHTLVHTVRSQTRLRERVVRSVREAIVAARPRIGAALLPGGAEAWFAAVREALASSVASEVEVFDANGVRVFAHPAASPVEHWPAPHELPPSGGVVTLGPFAGEATRVLTYASFRSGDRMLILRFSTPVPDLIQDLRESRQLLIGHGLALGVLLLAGGLALFPGTSDRAEGSPAALHAYEQAMEHLRDRGQELSKQHEVERQRMEEEIREKEAMARAGELTAGIVHEIRNGLGTIVGYARMLEREAPSPAAAEAGRSIREECETLEGVVRRFMEFVKQETLNEAPVDLGRMLSRVVARESRSRPGGEVSLPSGDLGSLVGDEALLERAFENLVRNAREAAGEGGQVSIAVARDGTSVAVTVSDNGPGLPLAMRKELRPFFTTKPGGLGLGLPLTLKIVRLHGGELSLAERSPRGVAVSVRLPLAGSRA